MLVFSFESPDVTLETAGGKGLNLARLTRAGFAVPRGFIISTEAYRAFVEANRWLSFIGSARETLSAEDVSALEKRSAQIRAAFSVGAMPEEVESAIRAAYQEFPGTPPVAVRSSATAEDLPDLSFAGQQDTYLNVAGEEELLKAVVSCWSSLWTARAIGYRLRNRIPQEDVALAVIVQEMVPSDVSGVMFTANPLTGLRSETVIDATFGLGEALVSGQVEPDHYVVNTQMSVIRSKTLGAKELSTRSAAGGGVEIRQEASAQQALTDEHILQLAELGRSIQKEYGFPQDIEWAFAAGKLYVLQARPITSLYPIPEESLDPLKAWFSFGAVQGMLQPLTPLGQDSIRLVLAGAAALFGIRLNHET
ncbi:MAG TPA: PEP/pyruvate-binding domain-containing protein, partial [Anaerolineales bacterium]|nr:PEP/pyruvate-binding domain-containing protein [Anaerolineales bacterium]